MCKSVAQIVELAAVKQFLRHVVLQPQHLGYLHLDGHLAADVAEKVVVGSIDLLCLLHRSVVKPQDYVAVIPVSVIEVRTGN
jgi:hypothetical protein